MKLQVVLVGEIWREGMCRCFWEIQFNRQAQDWELESFVNFYDLLYKFRRTEGTDKLRWKGSRLGSFIVKSYYERLIPKGGTENFL